LDESTTMYKECEAFAAYYSETTTSTTTTSSAATSSATSSSSSSSRIIANDKINIIDTASEVITRISDSGDGLEEKKIQIQRSVRTPPAFYNGCISRLLRLLELYALSNQQRVMPSITSSSNSSRGRGDTSSTPRVIKMLLKRLSLPIDQAGARLRHKNWHNLCLYNNTQ
jgi:hypothetical protein